MKKILMLGSLAILLSGCTALNTQLKGDANVNVNANGDNGSGQSEVEARATAESRARTWIVNNAETYKFDGSNLELQGSELTAEGYVVTFTFTSAQAGFGNRTGQFLAQVITDHTIEVTLRNGIEVSAVTDGTYDELNRTYLAE